MKRSRLERRTALRPGQPSLHRRGKMRKANPARKHARWLRAYGSEERVAFVQAMRCAIAGCERKSVNAHVKSKGSGGTAEDIANLCQPHHDLLHELGRETFGAYFNVNLEALAAAVAQAWRQQEGAV